MTQISGFNVISIHKLVIDLDLISINWGIYSVQYMPNFLKEKNAVKNATNAVNYGNPLVHHLNLNYTQGSFFFFYNNVIVIHFL